MTTLACAVAFVLGCWWLQQQPVLPSLAGAAAVVPLALLAVVLRRSGHGFGAGLCVAVALAVAGFHWAALSAQWKLASELPAHWEGRDIEVEGVIAEMPQRHARGTRVRFDIERALTPGADVPSRVVLNWYQDHAGLVPDAQGLRAAQRWRLTVRLRRPYGSYNPHGFDLERWLLEHDLRASGYVRLDAPRILTDDFVHRPTYLV
ncbi:MAG: ComEC/Rec2 family competence protein, partial [Burkholderiales bacterium]